MQIHPVPHPLLDAGSPSRASGPALAVRPRDTDAPMVTSRLVDSALVRTARDARWTVTCVEYPYGVVNLECSARLTKVVVGDRIAAAGSAREAASFSAAACTVDGELLVAVRDAPPAIVVSTGACRTRPCDGAAHDTEFPAAGERLILLSCAVFEAVPEVLVDGVNGTVSGRLATQHPESLLIDLVGGTACGAGVIIDHHPAVGGH